jgi:hypothetical protein
MPGEVNAAIEKLCMSHMQQMQTLHVCLVSMPHHPTCIASRPPIAQKVVYATYSRRW